MTHLEFLRLVRAFHARSKQCSLRIKETPTTIDIHCVRRRGFMLLRGFIRVHKKDVFRKYVHDYSPAYEAFVRAVKGNEDGLDNLSDVWVKPKHALVHVPRKQEPALVLDTQQCLFKPAERFLAYEKHRMATQQRRRLRKQRTPCPSTQGTTY